MQAFELLPCDGQMTDSLCSSIAQANKTKRRVTKKHVLARRSDLQ